MKHSTILAALFVLTTVLPASAEQFAVRIDAAYKGANPGLMRQLIDQIRNTVEPSAVLLLAAQGEGKVVLVAGSSRGLVEQGANAGNWVREVAPVVGGGGGGKPDMAQAGGKDASKIPSALEKATEIITQMLG